jgi:hypothetical protein
MKRKKELVVAGVTLIRNKPTACYGPSVGVCMYEFPFSYSFWRTTKSHEHKSLMLVEEEGKENNRRFAHQQFIARHRVG